MKNNMMHKLLTLALAGVMARFDKGLQSICKEI